MGAGRPTCRLPQNGISRIHAYGGGALSTYICDNDIRMARGLAAAAFGPIDFEGAFRLALLRADA